MAGYRAKPPKGSQLRRGDSLARGLISAYLFNEGAGNRYEDSASKNTGSRVNDVTWNKGQYGKHVTFDGAADVVRTTALPWAYPSTQAVLFRPASLAAAGCMCGYASSSNNNPAQIVQVQTNGSVIIVDEGDSGGSKTATTSASQVEAGYWAFAVAVFASVSSRTIYLFTRNGVVSASSTTTRTGSITAIDRFSMGAFDRLNLASSFNGDIAFCARWNAALSITDIRRLAADPFCLFRRRSVPVPLGYVVPATTVDEDDVRFGVVYSAGSPPAARDVRFGVVY